jgi:serpin B
MSAISSTNNQFAFELFNQPLLMTKNTFFSPLSLGAALAMTSVGAQKETEAQIKKVLHLPAKAHGQYRELLTALHSEGGYQLLIANRIWAEKSNAYRTEFLSALKDYYASDLGQVSFRTEPEASRAEINKWIAEHTAEKIPELFKSGDLTPDTDLVLTNAIYFKGSWKKKFPEAQTKNQDFHQSAEQKKIMPFMHLTSSFLYAHSDDFQMLSMPYQGDQLSFVALLPKEGTSLAVVELSQYQALSQKLTKTRVQVEMPKFRANSSMEMKEVLSLLGMPIAFDPANANFQGMRKLQAGENLFLSKVAHQAVVDINEEGTEAAAATGAVAAVRMTSLMPHKPVVVRMDRPFAYLIIHQKTGAILFMGRFQGPL